jgi:hypothetical protein
MDEMRVPFDSLKISDFLLENVFRGGYPGFVDRLAGIDLFGLAVLTFPYHTPRPSSNLFFENVCGFDVLSLGHHNVVAAVVLSGVITKNATALCANEFTIIIRE